MLCVALKIWKNSTAFLAYNTSSLTLRINIDGIPLANSVETCVWPILAVIKEILEVRVLMGGVYHGATQHGWSVSWRNMGGVYHGATN